jgi:hypothetical protein
VIPADTLIFDEEPPISYLDPAMSAAQRALVHAVEWVTGQRKLTAAVPDSQPCQPDPAASPDGRRNPPPLRHALGVTVGAPVPFADIAGTTNRAALATELCRRTSALAGIDTTVPGTIVELPRASQDKHKR